MSLKALSAALAASAARDANNGGVVMEAVKELKRRVNFAVIDGVRDENGFTPEEAAELMRRLREVRMGIVERHDLIEG